MPTKKKKKKSTVSEAVKLQKLANTSAVKIQNMVNQANKEQMSFNRSEAQQARDFNSQEAATARQFNAQEAEKARTWQTQMSNTSHQREVADLKKAGLNPVLSANSGGAQSYTTSSANAQNASGSGASTNVESGASMVGSIMSSLMSSMSALKQTQMQNDSALRVANINAAANKYATDVSANTARYVANTNYEATKYSSDLSYKTQMDKPQSSWAALADKYFGKDTVYYAKKFIKSFMPNGLEFDNNGSGLKNYNTYEKLLKGLGLTMQQDTDYDYGFGNKKGHGNGAFFKLIFKAVAIHDPKSILELAKYQVNRPNKSLLKVNHKYNGLQE